MFRVISYNILILVLLLVKMDNLLIGKQEDVNPVKRIFVKLVKNLLIIVQFVLMDYL